MFLRAGAVEEQSRYLRSYGIQDSKGKRLA